jgi:hypothetical protein
LQGMQRGSTTLKMVCALAKTTGKQDEEVHILVNFDWRKTAIGCLYAEGRLMPI